MKNYVLWMLTVLTGLTACSKDDDNNKVKLNRLTKVTCYKNAESTPSFQVEIFYNADGTISYQQHSEKGKLEFIYVDKRLTVSGTGAEKTEYSFNNNFITHKKIYATNPYASNTLYTSEEYTYSYKRNKLSAADKVLRWPQEGTNQYETRRYESYDNYIWTGNNLTMFRQETREMEYEYMPDDCPDNLPMIVPNTFSPVVFDLFDPINVYYGAPNSQLISRASWYNVPEASISAEYLFDYTFKNEYITTILIEEKNHRTEGGNNNYRIDLEYNYSGR